MFTICFCYASVMLSLLFFCVTAMFVLKLVLFFNSLFFKGYVSKELFIMAMVHSKKKKRIEEVPHGVKVITWLTAVQEAAFVLGKIETHVVTSPRSRSRSIIRAKLLALEMKALPKNANYDCLLADHHGSDLTHHSDP